MCKTVIVGKRNDRATKASALVESIRQSVDSASSSSHPSPMLADTVSPTGPPLIVRPIPVDTTSTGSPSSTPTPESARRIVGSARLKIRNPTALTPKKKRGFCSGKKAEDIVAQMGQKIKLQYCPCVKGPSVRGINSLVAHDIGSDIRSLVGMRARTFYDLDQLKYEWDENDEPMFNWILKRAHETYKDWKYQCHKAYLKEGPSDMPSNFIGREDQDSLWQTSGTVGRRLCTTTRGLLLSSTQWRNLEYKGSSFQLSKVLRRPMSGPVMKIRPRNIMTWLMGSINEMMHSRNNTLTRWRRRLWKVFSLNKLSCWVWCPKLGTERRSERGMGRGGEQDLSQSSNGSTSRSCPPRVDEQQLQKIQERYEQRLKESKERAQQQYQEVHQRALCAESMYSTVQSQFAAIYELLGMPPPSPPQFPPDPPPVVSPQYVSPQNNDDLGDNIELDN